jgi:hypothetical protein
MATTEYALIDGALIKSTTTGAEAIAASLAAKRVSRLISVSTKFSTAPTTSESITITLDANAGAAYDTLLYTLNPSTGATASFMWFPDQPLYLEPGDAIDIAFTNTDTRTYGVQITLLEEL